ncbi:MAG: S8 family serine peptidase, partial [Lachnospiraceae bacterium]|nr:S8 family serine peptidase [Lachnospiraceae bacterium]
QRSELIVKYNGDLTFLEEEGISVVTLYGGYAILEAPVNRLREIAKLPQIEYLEVPKRLYFSVNQGKTASCITSLQRRDATAPGLTGRGVLVGIIDSGIDLSHPDFRNPDGTTRVRWLWDQTATGGAPPVGYVYGVEYSQQEIDRLLEEREPLPGTDFERHGTPVTGIAAGNGRGSEGRFSGVATESELIIVKLGRPQPNSFPRTTELMQAMNYVVLKAAEERMPVAVNVSIGNNDGSHDGSAITERFFDSLAAVGRTVIVVGSGNEGYTGGHASGLLQNPVRGSNSQTEELELAVGAFETGLTVQLWKNYADRFEVTLITPSGQEVGPFLESMPVSRYSIPGGEVLALYGQPSPYRVAQELYLDFVPEGDYLVSGIYRIRLRPRVIVDGRYHVWLPSQAGRSESTRFLTPNPEVTLTIPSTAENVITVGAYDSGRETYAPFSGRGFTRTEAIKPDIAAPGVNIVSAEPGGGYAEFTGTSFAAPFVTGSVALMMEWGIVRGNDPFLYGEKVKAYLIRGAKNIPGFGEIPNPQIGWGALCLRESLPL